MFADGGGLRSGSRSWSARYRREKQQRRRKALRRTCLELLEPRIVLATMPAIQGTVFYDQNNNGIPNDGEELSGVPVELYLDNGDGHFDLDTDPLVGETVSDDRGFYLFENLEPDGAYFVRRPGVRLTDPELLLPTVISPLILPGAADRIIDRFRTQQIISAVPPPPSTAESTKAGLSELEVIGGERDLQAKLISGIGSVDLRVNPFGLEELLEFNQSPGTIGASVVTWDGIDGDAQLVSMGLGGQDLTSGGRNDGIVMRAGVDDSGAGTTVELRIYQGNSSRYSSVSRELPVTGGDASGFLFVPFSDFEGPVSPTRVDAIQLRINPLRQGSDGKIDLIAGLGPKVFNISQVVTADLAVTKSNGLEALLPGQDVEYIITARNLGPNPVEGARVRDFFPAAALENVHYTSVAFGNASGNTLQGQGDIDDLVNLDVGSSITYTVTAQVRTDVQDWVDNEVEIFTPAGVHDPKLTNNRAQDRDPIGVGIDLRAQKDDGRRDVMIGETLTYTITVWNDQLNPPLGPELGTAFGAQVVDEFPDTLIDVSYISEASEGVTGNTPEGTGDIRDTVNIPEGGWITYTVTATVADHAIGALENLVRVIEPPDRIELTPWNNAEIDVNLVHRELADVSVTKDNGQSEVIPGEDVEYTIIVSNAGPATASQVRLSDVFPDILEDVNYTSRRIGNASGNTESGSGNLDDLLELARGAAVIYTVTGTVRPSATGRLTNTVRAELPPIDPDLSNNTATDDDPLVPTADLSITKSDGHAQIHPGQELTYTIVVQNGGLSDAKGVRVVDVFPDTLNNVTFTSVAVGGAMGNTPQGSGNIDDRVDMPAGASITYTVQAIVDPAAVGTIQNTATVEPPDGLVDPNLGNNTATDITAVARGAVDLLLRKDSAEQVAVPGELVHYTLIVSNVGQSDLVGAIVTDTFPPELEQVTYTSEIIGEAAGNTVEGSGNIRDTVDLAVGASIIYSIQGRLVASATGTLRNLGRVDLPDEVDATPGNNLDLVVLPVVSYADLSVTKTDGQSIVDVGDRVTYTIVVRNAGPSDVRDVRVTDVIPAGLLDATYTSSATAGVEGNTPAGSGAIDDRVQLPAGSTLTYLLTGQVAADVSGVLVNTAKVSGPVGPTFVEIDPSNNVATDLNTLASVIALGSEPTVIHPDAIEQPGRTDRYRITAHSTGKLIISSWFDHGQGDLQLAVDDFQGNLIAESVSETSDERLVIPVVGQQTYYIRVFGATEEVTNRYDLEVENFPVPVPHVVRLTPESDTGWVDDDAVTADPTPTILLQADLDEFLRRGLALLEPVDPSTDNAHLPPGAGLAVEVFITDTVTGEQTMGYASRQGASDSLFAFTPLEETALTSGLYTVTAAVRVFDATVTDDGAPPISGRGTLSEPFTMTIDREAPATSARPDLIDSSDTGVSFRDDVTSKDQPAFQGAGEPNAKVRVLARRTTGDIEVIGEGVVSTEGRWEVTVEPLSDDAYQIWAQLEDRAGNVSALGNSLTVTIDTAVPNTPYLDLLQSHDTGASSRDEVTAVNTPRFSMTSHDSRVPVDGQDLMAFNYRYRLYLRADGSLEEDASDETLVYDSFLDLEIPLENLRDGLTDLTQLTRAVGPLPDGTHNFKLEIEDRAGNVSPDFLLTVTIDTQVPMTDLRLLESSDTGTYSDDAVTRNQQPVFGGTSEAGARVSLYADGILVGQGTVGTDETDGTPGDGQGAWTVTVGPLSDGAYEFHAVFEDQAGNLATSQTISLIVDTRAPNVPLLELLTDSGIDSHDHVTNDNTPTIRLTLGATLEGGANEYPNEIRFRVYDRSGETDGERLLLDSFGALGSLSELGTFTGTLPELSDGVHNLKVEVEDRAGNISQAFLRDVLIDTQAPPLPPFELIPSSDSGLIADDSVTQIAAPTFAGRSAIGETIFLFANGFLVGEGQVGGDETDGVADDGLGAWEITIQPLTDGFYEVTAHAEDRAGNVSQSESVSVWIDTTAPNLPLLTLLTEGGTPDDDGITNDRSPTVSVTANDTIEGGANPFPHDLLYRIYDRPGDSPEILLVDSYTSLGGFSEAGSFVVPLPEMTEGLHNLKLVVEDRAGNRSHEYLYTLQIDATPPVVGTIELARYSDSGVSDQDRVTNIRQPAILGTGSVGAEVVLLANGEIAGQTVIGKDETDGIPEDGLGAWEITVEPLDDDVYDLVARVVDAAGNVATSGPLKIEIDTLVPNTPYLDLLESDDTGRHNDDNITAAPRLAFSGTTSDANSDLHAILVPGGQNYRFRLFARPESGEEVLIYDSAQDSGLEGLRDGLTDQRQILTPPLNLPEGLHNLKLEVEDRAGNVSPDNLLPILIDRTAFRGTGRLHPSSDTGVAGLPGTFEDGVTNVRTPVFVGTAEADALVMVMVDGKPVGTTVALPLDGDDAVQPPNPPYAIEGNWQVTSSVVLSDGLHDVIFTFEDPAGNRASATIQVLVDTSGPSILNVTRNVEDFASVFDPKPASGPDPLMDSLVIHFGGRSTSSGETIAPAWPEAILSEEGHYVLVGDANGHIAIEWIDVETELADDGASVTRAVLYFSSPLPDDRYTLTISDDLTDGAGNRLDGESGARAPFEGKPGTQPLAPIFPTGDGVPGGDFVARFTVDSRPEVGTWSAGSVWTDTNGNFAFDPDNHDYTNRDIVYRYGFTSDDIFAGNFSLRRDDQTDGYDKLAAYGRFDGRFRWLVDTDNDGVPNIDREDPFAGNGLPVAGRFDDNDANGDEVAVFDGRAWYFDTDHDFRTDLKRTSWLVGYPVVGDFDGDGFDDLATWADNRFMVDLAKGSRRGWDGFPDYTFNFGFIGVRERPVAADMNQDGVDDLGLWVPDREGVTERAASEWYFLVSHGQSLLKRLSPQDDPLNSWPTIDFTPQPFGSDLYIQFGDDFAVPLVGNFDPPTSSAQRTDPLATNPSNARDVNDDGSVSPMDALLVINDLNERGARRLTNYVVGTPYLDVNSDQFVTPMDALIVLNELNGVRPANMQSAPVKAVIPQPEAAAAVLADELFAEGEAPWDDLDLAAPSAVLGRLTSDPPRVVQSAEGRRWSVMLDEIMVRWQQESASDSRRDSQSTTDQNGTTALTSDLLESGPPAP